MVIFFILQTMYTHVQKELVYFNDNNNNPLPINITPPNNKYAGDN